MPKRFSIIFVLVAALIAAAFLFGSQKNISFFSKKEDDKNNKIISFLLLGKTGKVIGWNQSPDLTDAIMVVEYRPKIGAANIVSLPRDLYVDLSSETFKLNEVAKRGKVAELMQEISKITGIEPDGYIIIDVDFLKKAVEELGGIEVDFDAPLVDWVSGYKIEAGKQYLNGEQAVWAVRNRYAPEGDFFREKNQQKITKAVIDKFRTLNSFQRTAFLFKIMPETNRLETNMDFQQFVSVLDNFESARINSVILDFSTGLLISSSTPGYINGASSSTAAYILLPKDGINSYGAIKEYIQSKMEK